MNERIRELYYECQDESQSTEQCYQKFAELIVRECADWLKQPVNQTPSCGTVMNITAERLKEHFGVEE